MRHRSFPSILLAFLAGTAPLLGLAEEQFGPDSTRPHPTTAQSDWPAGLVDLARHDSRVYSIWVNGHEDFHFQADGDALQQLIDLFSKMRMRDHEIRIEPGTPHAKPFHAAPVPYNAKVAFLGGIALAVTRGNMEPETHDTTLTIFLDPKTAATTLKKLTIPDNIILHNEIEGATLKGTATKPTRQVWHARIDFDDASPAADFEHDLSTRITLWEKHNPAPIPLGSVSHDGKFHAALSDAEVASLQSGESWLTMTVGNWSTKPEPKHPKLPVTSLTTDPAAAKPVTISKPGFYHGRILFEDGSPPVLDPLPWPGAQLRVTFPFTGGGEPDAEGYIRFFFTPAQFAELQSKKPGKNIHVPLYGQRGHSRALHSFPASILSTSKAAAGVVKIPKPTPPE